MSKKLLEITENIAGILNESLVKSIDFASDEIPVLISDLLHYKLFAEIILFSVFSVSAIVAFSFAIFLLFRRDYFMEAGFYAVILFISWFLLFLCSVVCFVTIIKIYYFPKVWMLEYIANILV